MPFAVVDRPGWRMATMASPAARALARYRINEADAAGLPLKRPPAWTFLTTRLNPSSSTKMRLRYAAPEQPA
jgi:nicotinate-nucleotide adenylyltransferase